jgi:hypothetical protein
MSRFRSLDISTLARKLLTIRPPPPPLPRTPPKTHAPAEPVPTELVAPTLVGASEFTTVVCKLLACMGRGDNVDAREEEEAGEGRDEGKDGSGAELDHVSWTEACVHGVHLRAMTECRCLVISAKSFMQAVMAEQDKTKKKVGG